MSSDAWLQLGLRTLPAIIIFVLAFVAATDRGTRERWSELLYQIGALRPDQRSDPRIQRGVRLPFFIVALALLVWPVLYYRYSTRKFEVKSDLYTSKPIKPSIYDQNTANSTSNSATAGTNSATTPNAATPGVHPMDNPAPGAATPGSSNPPNTNIYGGTR